MFFILVMLVPSLISKAAAAPAMLLAKGSEAWAAGRSRLKKGGKATVSVRDALAAEPGAGGPRSSQVELLRGNSSAAAAGAPAPLPERGASAALGGSAADPEACAAALAVPQGSVDSMKAEMAPAASAASSLSAEELEVVLPEKAAGHANTPLYLLWAVACYAIAVVLLAIGTESFVHNSVSALATVRGGRGALSTACASGRHRGCQCDSPGGWGGVCQQAAGCSGLVRSAR